MNKDDLGAIIYSVYNPKILGKDTEIRIEPMSNKTNVDVFSRYENKNYVFFSIKPISHLAGDNKYNRLVVTKEYELVAKLPQYGWNDFIPWYNIYG